MDPGFIPENWRKAENGRPRFELEGHRVFMYERGSAKLCTSCRCCGALPVGPKNKMAEALRTSANVEKICMTSPHAQNLTCEKDSLNRRDKSGSTWPMRSRSFFI